MAIGFVRSRYVSRSTGGNACRSSAYNARTILVDKSIGEVFDFSKKYGNIYHEVLLPYYVDKKFKNISTLANVVEKSEHRKDSQLYIEWVLALPKEQVITLEMQKELIYRFIEYKGWVKEGLGVQINIHNPHEGEDNVHAHLLFTTRRFTKDGLGFELKKARDLQPKVAHQKVVEETKDTIAWTNMQNEYYKECGLDLRVDLPGEITQEHIGPVRMRSVLNKAVERNEYRQQANIESLIDVQAVLDRITKHQNVFSEKDLVRSVKCLDDHQKAEQLVKEVLASDKIIALYHQDGQESGLYTTEEVRKEEQKLLRLASYINQQANVFTIGRHTGQVKQLIKDNKSLTVYQASALSHVLLVDSGIRVLKGRAGTGKSYVLGEVARIAKACNVEVVGLSPTHKAKQELQKVGYNRTDTIKGFLFKLYNNKAELSDNSLVVVDEAAMVGNDDYSELLRIAASRKCNVILAGDERQLSSIQRGGMFGELAERFSYYELSDIRRQKVSWGRQHNC